MKKIILASVISILCIVAYEQANGDEKPKWNTQNKGHGWAFLQDVQFNFKTFQIEGDPQETSLGFDYSYNNEWTAVMLSQDNDVSLKYGIAAQGNVAFDKRVNPNDFLDTKLTFGAHYSAGGEFKYTEEERARLVEIALEQSKYKKQDPRYQALEAELRQINNKASASNVFVGTLGLKAGLESNQDLSKQQYVYGLQAGLIGVGLEKRGAAQYSEASTFSKLNIFDYPFALLRIFTGAEKSFVPKGEYFPVVLIGISQVKPEKDDPRKALGEDSAYPRFDGEVAFKTLLAKKNDDAIYFTMDYRIYHEIGASQAIKEAGLSKSAYTALKVGGGQGPFIAYTRGKLPLDAQKDKVYELGYTVQF